MSERTKDKKKNRSFFRKIVVNGTVWSYHIGGSNIILKDQNGKKIIASFSDFFGPDYEVRYKEEVGVTPSRIEDYIYKYATENKDVWIKARNGDVSILNIKNIKTIKDSHENTPVHYLASIGKFDILKYHISYVIKNMHDETPKDMLCKYLRWHNYSETLINYIIRLYKNKIKIKTSYS